MKKKENKEIEIWKAWNYQINNNGNKRKYEIAN